VRQIPVVEQLIPERHGHNTDQLHLFACVGKDNVYGDIHVSKVGVTAGDDSLLRQIVVSLDIVAAAAATSLDHFRAGSAPFLQGQYAQAIPHYEQALVLEQATPKLDKALWRLLVGNLGVAYGLTGGLSRSKTTFDYGLSQDPGNPLFHYNLARIFAQMNDRDRAIQSLHAAFGNNRQRNPDETMPDPRQDVSFRRLMLDPAFRTLAESLMQPAT
jgi:tetratricopeptide (TPR) repeat protein